MPPVQDSSNENIGSLTWYEMISAFPPARLAEGVLAAIKERNPASPAEVRVGNSKTHPSSRREYVSSYSVYSYYSPSSTVNVTIYSDRETSTGNQSSRNLSSRSGRAMWNSWQETDTSSFQEIIEGWPTFQILGTRDVTSKGVLSRSIYARSVINIGNVDILGRASVAIEDPDEQVTGESRSDFKSKESTPTQQAGRESDPSVRARDTALAAARLGLELIERACILLPSLAVTATLETPESVRSWPDPAEYGPGEQSGLGALYQDDESEEAESDDEAIDGLLAETSSIVCPYCETSVIEGCQHFVDMWDDELRYAGCVISETFNSVGKALDDVDTDRVEFNLDPANLHKETKELLSTLMRPQDLGSDTAFLDWLEINCGAYCDSAWWEGSAVSGQTTACFHRDPRYLSDLLEAVMNEALDWLDDLLEEPDDVIEDE